MAQEHRNQSCGFIRFCIGPWAKAGRSGWFCPLAQRRGRTVATVGSGNNEPGDRRMGRGSGWRLYPCLDQLRACLKPSLCAEAAFPRTPRLPPPLLVDPHPRTTRMAWTTEDRRRYAPALQEVVRQGMLVRLAAMIDAIDPPAPAGRPRVWPTLVMLQALWHLARDDRAWRRLPPGSPPHQTVWSRLQSWRRQAVLDRAPRILVACRRLAAGRKRRPTAATIDTQSVKTGPRRGSRGYDANKKITRV